MWEDSFTDNIENYEDEFFEDTPRFTEPKQEQITENIRVVCRFRPENDEEKREGMKFVSIKDDQTVITHKESIYGESQYEFQYNRVFPDYSSTADVYRYISEPLVDDVLNGFNGCIMAYGQTGTGKTYSMLGPGMEDARSDSKVSGILSGHSRGIIPRIMEAIFDRIRNADKEMVIELSASYIEIYRETLFDLLAPPDKITDPNKKIMNASKDNNKKLVIQESVTRGMWIKNATEVAIVEPSDVLMLMHRGNINRIVAATSQNKESSRSHAIFIVSVKVEDRMRNTERASQMYLADLAGSERMEGGKQEHHATYDEAEVRRSEAKKINTSLFALGRVIHALATGGKHISFRDSKLTRILQNSLGGNSKTTLLIHCSPNSLNKEETLSTLRFGEKTKSIMNKPTVREQLNADQLAKMLDKANLEVERQKSYIKALEMDLQATILALSNGNTNFNFNNLKLNFNNNSNNNNNNNNNNKNDDNNTTTTTTTTTTTSSSPPKEFVPEINIENEISENSNTNSDNNSSNTDSDSKENDTNTYNNDTNNTNTNNDNSNSNKPVPVIPQINLTPPKTPPPNKSPSPKNLPKISKHSPLTSSASSPSLSLSMRPKTSPPKTPSSSSSSSSSSIPRVNSTSSVSGPRTPRTPKTPTHTSTIVRQPVQTFTAHETLHFTCPLTGMVFVDPVIACDGYTYEREAIVKYIKWAKKSPVTRTELTSQELIPNYTLLRQLQNIKARLVHTHMPFLDMLPHWVLIEVFTLLSLKNLLRVALYYNRLSNDNRLWNKLEQKLTNPIRDLSIAPKQRYIQAYKRDNKPQKKRKDGEFREVSHNICLVTGRN